MSLKLYLFVVVYIYHIYGRMTFSNNCPIPLFFDECVGGNDCDKCTPCKLFNDEQVVDYDLCEAESDTSCVHYNANGDAEDCIKPKLDCEEREIQIPESLEACEFCDHTNCGFCGFSPDCTQQPHIDCSLDCFGRCIGNDHNEIPTLCFCKKHPTDNCRKSGGNGIKSCNKGSEPSYLFCNDKSQNVVCSPCNDKSQNNCYLDCNGKCVAEYDDEKKGIRTVEECYCKFPPARVCPFSRVGDVYAGWPEEVNCSKSEPCDKDEEAGWGDCYFEPCSGWCVSQKEIIKDVYDYKRCQRCRTTETLISCDKPKCNAAKCADCRPCHLDGTTNGCYRDCDGQCVYDIKKNGVLSVGLCHSCAGAKANAEPFSEPIVVNQPDVVPNDDESWLEHKYITAIFENHMPLIIGLSSALFVLISLAICVEIYRCKHGRNRGSSRKGINDQSDQSDSETKPFNDK